MGKIDISGRSIHEDPTKFFDPLYDWIENYCKNPPETTNVNIELEYFNSGSARYILKILKRLGLLVDEGKKLITGIICDPFRTKISILKISLNVNIYICIEKLKSTSPNYFNSLIFF